MGCGKSSVGRELSQLLCCPFMDLDQVIEERAGRTIPEIFSQDGEPTFRQIELDVLRYVVCEGWSKTKSLPLRGPLPFTRPRAAMVFDSPLTNHQMVLALGGGAVMTAECAEIVRSETLCVYLRASVDTLMEHLEGQTDNRPLLSQKHSLNEISTRHCEESEGRRGNLELETRIKELMAIRSATYENTAHIIIDIDGKSIEAIASEIISRLG